ncbi:MAG: tRNA uridine-5-carboxymethylaminomethyl(34) synthesis GTPase MnmE [Candidatus Neomarinimicrobiota bacterium]
MVATDTIVASATPFGISGIAVVRLSGSGALDIATQLSTAAGTRSLTFKPRLATHVFLYVDGQPFDEVIATYFKAPFSYTGDDMVEVSCHGNPVIVESVIAESCRLGARVAEPGEFTRRAFLNGKLDLVQAESVAGIIGAQSAESSRLNLRLLQGQLSERLFDLRDRIIALLAEVEFELDVSEDEMNPGLKTKTQNILSGLLTDIHRLLATYAQGRILSKGVDVVIIGAPNVGKSTLLNALSARERAIVSAIPGTTRDTIDVPLLIEGVPINLIDTAGLRTNAEEIEREGIRRTHQRINTADLLLLVCEPPYVNQLPAFNNPGNVQVIVVNNKIDKLPDKSPNYNIARDAVYISAKEGAGLDVLRSRIKAALNISSGPASEVMLTTARQHQALDKCRTTLDSAALLMTSAKTEFELVALELRESIDAIDKLLGKTTADEILNRIFGAFCVGK